ncbi:MAG: EscU/YscU/HrcU family type III secretion system export apparatus switch protein [Candidatus Eremiobacteraeota bacterium]|nr:EscU/YscU/HrcU family type III secretion system export apparatus switch protein [Candidatus Eremiobacteraeota bacterium]
MAEQSGEKHFEATQTRMQRARSEGNSAKSQELGAVAAFAGAAVACALTVAPIGAAARTALAAAAAGGSDRAALATICALMLIPVCCAASASALVSLLQSGGLRLVAVAAKAERLSPVEGCKRMFSREALVAGARAAAAFACAAAALIPFVRDAFGVAVRGEGVASVAAVAWAGAVRSAVTACAVGGAFSLLDYGLQVANWRKKLRMSFEELRREQKEQDGDPAARGRRKQFHRQLSAGTIERVKAAAFVVVNPEHIAMAIEYRPPDVPVPRVLVRAADEVAARVRELARAHGIPLVENVTLARALYASAKPGEAIPGSTYAAVAEVVAALTRSGSSA